MCYVSCFDFRYQDNVNKLSRIYKDQPNDPMTRAVYWTEYIIRHKGNNVFSLLNILIYCCWTSKTKWNNGSLWFLIISGALHLRSAGRKLNFLQYHSIDVIFSVLAILSVFAFLFYKLVS